MSVLSHINEKYDSMSKSQQVIARYFSDCPDSVIFDKIADIAAKTGMSPATIVRFCVFLGYEGFSHLREQMRSEFPMTQEKKSENSLDNHTYSLCPNKGQIEKIIAGKEFKSAAKLLMSKKNLIIIGYMDSFGTAGEFLHFFENVRPNVFFSRLINDWGELLRLMGDDCGVLVTSFRPHYEYSLICANAASERGAAIVSLTDNPLNPFRPLSQINLSLDIEHSPLGVTDKTPVAYFQKLMFEYILEHYERDIKEFASSNKKRVEFFVE